MHYFIDGYNLLFRLVRAGDDLQAQREMIIQDLSTKIKFLGLDATIVFDAQYQVGESTKVHVQDLEVLFTAQGDTADECIIDELKTVSDTRQETVVTSDKKLAWRARRKAAHSESVEEFMEWLNRRYKNKIRNLKHEKKQLIPAKKSSPPSVPVKKLPDAKSLPEDCLEYYAEIFEKQLEEIAPLTPPKASKNPPKLRTTPPKDTRSDFDRWLDIFEKTPSADDKR